MEDQVYKIVLVGDSNVGKTCIFTKYIKNQLPKINEPTVGQEFKTKPVIMQNGKQIKASIWDTAGQERYRSLMASNFRNAVGILLVYDISQRESFDGLEKWIEEIKQSSLPGVVISVVWNKSDLSANRVVQQTEGENFSSQHKASFIETSALNGNNINDIFNALLNQIYTKKKQQDANQPSTTANAQISVQSQPNENKCAC